MAYSGISVVITVSLVLIGSIPCMSDECSRDSINKCHSYLNDNKCPFYSKILPCLAEIQANCTDDRLGREIKFDISWFTRLSKQCPGLPEGECYLDTIGTCGKHIPYDVLHARFLKDEDKKKMCDDFESHINSTKACIRNVKNLCWETHTHDQVEVDISNIERIEKKCGYDDQE